LLLSLAAAFLLGACKATDTAGNMSASTSVGTSASAQKAGEKPKPSASTTTGTTEVHADGVRRVKPEELQAMVEAGRAAIYDTRSKMAYDAEHIKGALSMPHEEVANRVGEFPKDKTLVFYCT
jgi:3-mercaptopyruvate sulfurtransferase SseA